MRVLSISTLAISSLAFASAVELAEQLRFKTHSSGSSVPTLESIPTASLLASTNAPSENLEVREAKVGNFRRAWGAWGAPWGRPQGPPGQPNPPSASSSSSDKTSATHTATPAFSAPSSPSTTSSESSNPGSLGKPSSASPIDTATPSLQPSKSDSPSTTSIVNPSATTPEPSETVVTTTEWLETSDSISSTWVPATYTLTFKLLGETPAPAPGKGEIGLGSLTEKGNQPTSVAAPKGGGAVQTGVPRVLGVGVGVVGAVVGVVGLM